MNPSEIAAQLANVYTLILPEIVLILAACAMVLAGTFRGDRHFWAGVALVVLAGAAVVQVRMGLPHGLAPDAIRPLAYDNLALLVRVLALAGGAVLVLLSWDAVPDEHAADWYACLLIVVAGLGITGAANDLVLLFLGLELISIPTYVILYLQRSDVGAQEAAAKYFLLSIFSTAILLFGFSYLYGLGGTTNLTALLNALRGGEGERLPLLAVVALVMVAAGFGFKIAAVPFHFYAPDVYQGTTLSGAALLAFVPKVAGFVGLLRVFGFIWPEGGRPPGLALGSQAPILFWILAVMTMSVGNILALLQDNLRRILAYSSVAHAGYMLIGLAVAPDLARQPIMGGVEAMLFYLVAYVAMTIGAFGVISYLSAGSQPVETVDDLAGVSRSQPGMALLMALFMFSLIGIPGTAGFAGKMFLFLGALSVSPESAGDDHARLFRILALIGAINAAVGAWYYLRIVAAMYLRTPIRPVERPRAWPGLAAVWVCAAVTLVAGVWAQPLMNAVRAAAGQ